MYFNLHICIKVCMYVYAFLYVSIRMKYLSVYVLEYVGCASCCWGLDKPYSCTSCTLAGFSRRRVRYAADRRNVWMPHSFGLFWAFFVERRDAFCRPPLSSVAARACPLGVNGVVLRGVHLFPRVLVNPDNPLSQPLCCWLLLTAIVPLRFDSQPWIDPLNKTQYGYLTEFCDFLTNVFRILAIVVNLLS